MKAAQAIGRCWRYVLEMDLALGDEFHEGNVPAQ